MLAAFLIAERGCVSCCRRAVEQWFFRHAFTPNRWLAGSRRDIKGSGDNPLAICDSQSQSYALGSDEIEIAIMKTVPMACLTVFALWIGYSLGYHQGAQNEETAWLSTHVIPDRTDGDVFCYRNPHSGPVHNSLGIATVNRPDPRTYKQYGHVLP